MDDYSKTMFLSGWRINCPYHLAYFMNDNFILNFDDNVDIKLLAG
jgi:hypothetical protein